MTQKDTAHVHVLNVLDINVTLPPYQPLTAMPECSQSSKRQRPDYLADFSSGSSADNSCSSSDEDEEERRKAGEGDGREGEKKEKKVSYDLGENKERDRAERSGETTLFIFIFIFSRLSGCGNVFLIVIYFAEVTICQNTLSQIKNLECRE